MMHKELQCAENCSYIEISRQTFSFIVYFFPPIWSENYTANSWGGVMNKYTKNYHPKVNRKRVIEARRVDLGATVRKLISLRSLRLIKSNIGVGG